MSLTTLQQNPNFLLLWLAQVISGIGDVLYTVGIMVSVYNFTGSALQTAMIMVATTLPPFLLGPVAGAIVDRYPRKWVLIITDVIRAVLVLLLLFCVHEEGFNLWGLYALVGSLAVATTFHFPAQKAIIPSIVKPENLGQANSILIGTGQGIMALGFAIGGLLTLWLNFETFILIDALTFVVAIVLIFFIQTPYEVVKDASNTEQSLLGEAVQGFHDLRAHKLAYPLVVMEILEHIPHGIWTSVIILAFVENALQGSADDWGYLVATYFGGMFLGAVIATWASKTINRRTGGIIVVNAFVTSILTILFSFSPTVVIAIGLALVFGLPNSLRDVAQDTLLQTSVNQDLLGRVYAFRSMFTNIMFMISGILFAWMADVTSVRYVYFLGGILYLVTAFYALGNKALRESRVESI